MCYRNVTDEICSIYEPSGLGNGEWGRQGGGGSLAWAVLGPDLRCLYVKMLINLHVNQTKPPSRSCSARIKCRISEITYILGYLKNISLNDQ